MSINEKWYLLYLVVRDKYVIEFYELDFLSKLR